MTLKSVAVLAGVLMFAIPGARAGKPVVQASPLHYVNITRAIAGDGPDMDLSQPPGVVNGTGCAWLQDDEVVWWGQRGWLDGGASAAGNDCLIQDTLVGQHILGF